jgi:hypothetical protein
MIGTCHICGKRGHWTLVGPNGPLCNYHAASPTPDPPTLRPSLDEVRITPGVRVRPSGLAERLAAG